MLNIERAPQKGTLYAAYVDRMVLRAYESTEELTEYLEEKNLLELHLFDQKRELRFIRKRTGAIETYEIADGDGYDDSYTESAYVLGTNIDKTENLERKIEVVNYIRYDENDLLHIVNYRLKEVGTWKKNVL